MNGASDNAKKSARERAWRCTCGALLGVHRGAELHIKHKDHHGIIVGTFRTQCRRCWQHNETKTMNTTALAVA